jgi:hypothetical protein
MLPVVKEKIAEIQNVTRNCGLILSLGRSSFTFHSFLMPFVAGHFLHLA